MSDVFMSNLRMRIAYLNRSWEELAKLAGEKPGNVRGWVSRGNPRGDTVERLAKVVGVPTHELYNPAFNPREWPMPEEEEGQ